MMLQLPLPLAHLGSSFLAPTPVPTPAPTPAPTQIDLGASSSDHSHSHEHEHGAECGAGCTDPSHNHSHDHAPAAAAAHSHEHEHGAECGPGCNDPTHNHSHSHAKKMHDDKVGRAPGAAHPAPCTAAPSRPGCATGPCMQPAPSAVQLGRARNRLRHSFDSFARDSSPQVERPNLNSQVSSLSFSIEGEMDLDKVRPQAEAGARAARGAATCRFERCAEWPRSDPLPQRLQRALRAHK